MCRAGSLAVPTWNGGQSAIGRRFAFVSENFTQGSIALPTLGEKIAKIRHFSKLARPLLH
jgi:hypothetical protein